MKISHSFFPILFFLSLLLPCTLLYSQTQYQIYHSWNFESEALGSYTDAEIAQDFQVITNYSHNSASISQEVLNGQSTKVLKITHLAQKLSVGFDLDAKLVKDFDEVYLSYNFRFSNEFNSTTGGKLPGLGGSPCVVANKYPTPTQGFLCKSLFKQGGRTCTYHYDRTTGSCPWSTDAYNFNPIYFSNGVWYNITRRVKMNTFTNGVANADGICELWVDGRMIFKETNLKLMVTESSTMKIDDINIAHFYGGSSDDCKPLHECYGYIDNIVVYTPKDDPTFGTKNTHDPSKILLTPSPITDRNVYYDKLITAAGTLRNAEYGKNYSPCIDEAYLIDAGDGKTVTYTATWNIGGGDYLFFYDGNRSDSKLIKVVQGSNSATNQSLKSTGRYMFVRFSSNTDGGTTGFTGTISFNQTAPVPTVPLAPASLQSTAASSTSVRLNWVENANNEKGIRIERKTGSGTYSQIAQLQVNSNTYTDAGLSASNAYTYRVYAFNDAGNSTFSNESTVQLQSGSAIINLAPGKPVIQSSTAYGGVAERGNDNNTNGDFSMNSVTHTTNEQSPYWQIDLQARYNLDHITIWNRTNSCCIGRFENYYVFVSDVPFASTTLAGTLSQSGVWNKFTASYPNPSIVIPINRTGRYVRIQFKYAGEMNLAEAQIFGSSVSVSSPDPQTIPVNAAPTIENQEFIIQHPGMNNGSIGRVYAFDTDADQRLSYSFVSGNESGLFLLDSETGDLSLADDPNFSSDTTAYELGVKVTDNAPEPASSTANVTLKFVSTPTAINENDARNYSINLYPNPASGSFMLKMTLPAGTSPGQCELKLLDVSGRVVLTGNLDVSDGEIHQNIDLTGLSDGLYIVRVHAGTTDLNEKLVIRK